MYSRCLLLSPPAAPLTFPPHNKRAPLNALYGVVVGVLESCHLIRSEDFAISQSQVEIQRRIQDPLRAATGVGVTDRGRIALISYGKTRPEKDGHQKEPKVDTPSLL